MLALINDTSLTNNSNSDIKSTPKQRELGCLQCVESEAVIYITQPTRWTCVSFLLSFFVLCSSCISFIGLTFLLLPPTFFSTPFSSLPFFLSRILNLFVPSPCSLHTLYLLFSFSSLYFSPFFLHLFFSTFLFFGSISSVIFLHFPLFLLLFSLFFPIGLFLSHFPLLFVISFSTLLSVSPFFLPSYSFLSSSFS